MIISHIYKIRKRNLGSQYEKCDRLICQVKALKTNLYVQQI